MAARTNVDPIPSMARLTNAGWGALAGVGAGLGVVIGTALLGRTLGPIVGGVVSGAIIGGQVGQIAAVNGAMDAVILASAS